MKRLFQILSVIFISYFPLIFSAYKYEYELVVATMFRNEEHYLREWIEYHRLLGAEHFYLYNDSSTDNWQEILKPYIEKNIVEVFDWEVPNPKQDFYTEYQVAAFKNALERTKGKTSWLAFIDPDEFIVPMKEGSVPECITKHFKDASAIYVNWRCFGSGGVYVKKGDPIISQLTACSLLGNPSNSTGKTIVRPEHADIKQIRNVHHIPLLDTATYYDGNGKHITKKKDGSIKPYGPHASLIRINHYVMRDEDFFLNVRLKRAKDGYSGYYIKKTESLERQNKEYSYIKDYRIIHLLEKHYPNQYQNFWKSE